MLGLIVAPQKYFISKWISVLYMEALYDLFSVLSLIYFDTLQKEFIDTVRNITNTLQLSGPKYVDMDVISSVILSV